MKIFHYPLLLLSYLALGSFGLFGSLNAQAGAQASAKVLSVTGTVAKSTGGHDFTPLTAGAMLTQGDIVTTSHLSSATLVFSNGSQLVVEENSSLSLVEMKQAAFSGGKTFEQLDADPSVSTNRVELNYGKVSGHVKRLRSGSTFHVESALGTAAIRGTEFSVELRYNAERGEFILSVYNKDGLVDVVSQYSGTFNFGSSNIAEKSFDSTSGEATPEAIPPQHVIVIRLSKDDPYYDVVINNLKNYPPFQNELGQPPVIVEEPVPTFTPEDASIIVVSPEIPFF